jgi:hypothetical protein
MEGSNLRKTTVESTFGRIFTCLVVLIVSVFSLGSKAQATEGGGGAYPNGAESFLAAALPPPGLYYINYLAHYSSDRLNDKNGDKVPIVG